jgi:tetratricopeptide (TPR) repeat protein
MWRTVSLILCLLAGPVMADPATEVQRRIDVAGALPSDTREAALERVLLLREAEGIADDVLSAGPPKREDWPLVSPEARAVRAALRDAAAKDFTPFCEGREPGECLVADVEALLAEVPEVAREAKREGAIGPSGAERKIAILLAETGHYQKAADIAEGIADPFDQARTIRDVVMTHLRRDGPRAAKRLEDVDELIAKISRNPAIIAELATGIAAWLAEQGDSEGSVEILTRAEQFAALVGDEGGKGEALAFVGRLYLDLDEIDDAEALIEQIDDDLWRDALKDWIARWNAERGDFAVAERRAESIEDPGERAESLRAVAVEMAKAGELSEAQRVAGRPKDPYYRVVALLAVAVALVEAGREGAVEVFAEAEALARGIEEAEDRVVALGEVAASLIKAGSSPAAEDMAVELVSMEATPRRVSFVLEHIAETFRDEGQGEAALRYVLQAVDVMRDAEDVESRSGHELDLARLLISLPAHAEAEQVAVGIDAPSSRVFALKDLAVALVQSGADQPGRKDDVRRIVALIKRIEGAEEWRGDGLMEVAEALAEVGDVAEAEAVVSGIVEPVRRNEAMAGVATALANGGQLVEAWRIAGQVADPAWRAVAQAAVAAQL